MKTSLLLAALCLGIASAIPKLDHSLNAEWYQWKATYRRLYGAVGNIGTVERDPTEKGPCS